MIDWRICKNDECSLPHPVVACLSYIFEIFIAKNVCTSCLRAS